MNFCRKRGIPCLWTYFLFISTCIPFPAVTSLLCVLSFHDVIYQPNVMRRHSTESGYFIICHPFEENGHVSELMYSLELPSRMLRQVKPALLRGEELLLNIHGGYVHGDRVLYGNSSALKLIEDPFGSRTLQERKLRAPPLEGDLSVIILRITATDAQPTDSAETLYNLTFLSEVSLRSQLYKCSVGKVRLAPTEYGVMEVAVNISATGNSQFTIINSAYQSALHLIPPGVQDIRSLADFVMLVLPPGTGNWAAFGAIPGKQTAYNDKYVGAIVLLQTIF